MNEISIGKSIFFRKSKLRLKKNLSKAIRTVMNVREPKREAV
ncbi:hypothetical protein [Alkalihalobacillus hemicellulosilyticus]|nr:hypothetical protein [Halalkalibacter hemicellulosilyticus]